MKVAFQDDQLWFSAPGGIGTYVWELSGALAALADVDLVGFHARWRDDPPRRRLDMPSVTLGLPPKATYLGWSTIRRPRLPRALDDAAVVHATNPATIPPVRAGQALVVTIHDLAFEEQPEAFPGIWLRLYRRGLSIARDEASTVLVPSEYVAGRVREHGIDAARVRVTPLAGRPAAVPAPTLGAEAIVANLGIEGPYVLAVGTFEPRKNQALLVRAYRSAVAEHGLPHALVLAGHRGWRTDDLDAAIAQGGAGRIVRIEHAGDMELDALYRGGAALAYVSLSEGFGMPVLEAMARGTPVVASSTTSIPEVAGDAAVLVDPADEAAIAGALASVLTDAAATAELRRRGFERAKGFTWEATARATLQAYRQTVEAR